MDTLREKLMRLARSYAEATGAKSRQEGGGIALSGISTKIFNDGKTLDRIAAGRDIVTGSYERAVQWFSNNWPDEVEWPEGVYRPAPVITEAPPQAEEAAA